MEIGAVANRFFHAIGQVAKCIERAFDGYRQDRADAVLGNDNVNSLRLESSEDYTLSRSA
jgi:hypothetical protein